VNDSCGIGDGSKIDNIDDGLHRWHVEDAGGALGCCSTAFFVEADVAGGVAVERWPTWRAMSSSGTPSSLMAVTTVRRPTCVPSFGGFGRTAKPHERNGRDSNPRGLRPVAFKATAIVHSATVPPSRLPA
jgi:hypothetical protein